MLWALTRLGRAGAANLLPFLFDTLGCESPNLGLSVSSISFISLDEQKAHLICVLLHTCFGRSLSCWHPHALPPDIPCISPLLPPLSFEGSMDRPAPICFPFPPAMHAAAGWLLAAAVLIDTDLLIAPLPCRALCGDMLCAFFCCCVTLLPAHHDTRDLLVRALLFSFSALPNCTSRTVYIYICSTLACNAF